VVGHDISALMEYKGLSLAAAAQTVLDKMQKLGGDGGLIGLDAKGNVTMPFNTAGMYRGTITEDGKIMVQIYK
jgi:beta-aspartyl-peptidase (threonine type)